MAHEADVSRDVVLAAHMSVYDIVGVVSMHFKTCTFARQQSGRTICVETILARRTGFSAHAPITQGTRPILRERAWGVGVSESVYPNLYMSIQTDVS